MKTNLLSFIFSLLSLLAYGQQRQARREIPTAWIEKLQKYDYKASANDLVREFQTYIAPDSLVRFDKEAFLSPMFVNLDEDKEIEVLILFNNTFVVLKSIDNKWFMIHKEDETQSCFSFKILDTPQSQNKIICLEVWNEEKDSVFLYFYRFYRLFENKIYLCGEFVHQLVNSDKKGTQTVENTFELLRNQHIVLKYHYFYFYEVPVKPINPNILPSSVQPIFEGIVYGRYAWNDQEKKFLPNFNEDFTPETLDWLEGKSINNTFFRKELKYVETSGTKEQKKLLKQYLKDYKKD